MRAPTVGLLVLLGGALAGCQDEVAGEGGADYQLRDIQPALGDSARDDARLLDAEIDGPADRPDSASRDSGAAFDTGPARDIGVASDGMASDAMTTDAIPIIDAMPVIDAMPLPPDMAPDIPPGREPCLRGPGWSLLRIRYDDGSTSPRVDHWDAPCDYSIRINDACGVFDRCRGAVGCEVGRTNTGAVELDGSDDMLIWFDTQGLNVQAAVFHVLGRSLCAASSTDFDISSPTGGWALSGGPVGQQFEYQWHFAALPAFPPDDTALILTAGRGCGRLGVQAFEICVP